MRPAVMQVTPVTTSCVAPERKRSMAMAASLSEGLPSTLPSLATMVSAVIISSSLPICGL